MDRFRKVTAGSYALKVATRDEDGNAITVTTPTLSIADGAGTEVYSSQPAAANGQLSASVPAASLPALDTYRATWAGDQGSWVTYVEICGAYLFETADLKAFDSSLAAKSEDELRAARTAAEIRFERACRLALVPRGRRISTTGEGSARLRLPTKAPRSFLSGSIAGTALTAEELAELTAQGWGAVDRPSGKLWPLGSEIVLHLEHGLDYPPEDAARAAMILAREYLVRSALSSRAVAEQTDVGFLRLSIAGRDGPTGLPDVDAVARDLARLFPLIG